MKSSLLEWIVCPADGKPLALEGQQRSQDEILEGFLRCEAGHRYPIREGVPCFQPLKESTGQIQHTTDAFSSKWKRIPDFGFEPQSQNFYVQWYLERAGFSDVQGLHNFLKGKRNILDAGTGLGRDALLFSKNSDGMVFALDISESIHLAYRRLGHLPNVHFLQGSLRALPFPKGFFDYVSSDGVLHHTQDTESSFRSLLNHLKQGGQLAAYIYRKKGPVREFSDDFLRDKYTQSSEEECYAFSRAVTLLGKALSDLKGTVNVPEPIPALGIPAGPQDIQRLIYWHFLKCYWNDSLDFDVNVMTNFDWYRPAYAHRHTPEEVKSWCASAGAPIEHFHVCESGITVRCKKP